MANLQDTLSKARGFGLHLALAGTVALSVGLVPLSGALATSPPVCKPSVSATGTAAAGPSGRGHAILAWKDKVTGLYGASFANYNHARDESMECTDVTPKQPPDSPPLVKMYQCTFKALPCNK